MFAAPGLLSLAFAPAPVYKERLGAVQQEQGKLCGKWRWVKDSDTIIVIGPGQISFHCNRFKLTGHDVSGALKKFDMEGAGRRYEAIYRIDGDQLTLTIGGENNRPRSMDNLDLHPDLLIAHRLK